MNIHTFICIYTNIYIYICICTWIRTHIHTHTRTQERRCCIVLQCVAVCCSVLQCAARAHIHGGLIPVRTYKYVYIRTYVRVNIHVYMCLTVDFSYLITLVSGVSTGWHRIIGCLIFRGHFPQKSPRIRGSFAKNDLQLTRYFMGLRHPVC